MLTLEEKTALTSSSPDLSGILGRLPQAPLTLWVLETHHWTRCDPASKTVLTEISTKIKTDSKDQHCGREPQDAQRIPNREVYPGLRVREGISGELTLELQGAEEETGQDQGLPGHKPQHVQRSWGKRRSDACKEAASAVPREQTGEVSQLSLERQAGPDPVE